MAAIGGTYPTTAASVAEWLSALNLSKHEAALTGAGITQVSPVSYTHLTLPTILLV